ncbi:MAG: hypothetical protein R3C68_06830 [Myxococcota bacterium]
MPSKGAANQQRDLMHWARCAAKKRSDILLANNEDCQSLTHGDARGESGMVA